MAASDYFHRKPSFNRSRSGLGGAPGVVTPGSPHTPLLNRSLSSQLASPASFRVEDETLVFEIGSRSFRAGFVGDSAPRCIIPFSPEQSGRVHDFSKLKPTFPTDNEWGKDWELWHLDIRNVNLGLVEDKIERAVRDAHTKYIMLDQRARRLVLVLPPTLPHPLIGSVLGILFNSFQPSSVQLWATPTLCAVSAGLRSALLIDIGWHETTTTAIYEYREVLHKRSSRGAKALSLKMANTLRQHTSSPVSFHAVEDVVTRLAWCRSESNQKVDGQVSVPLDSQSIDIPFETLADPTEETFFGSSTSASHVDDYDLPIHLLAYRCLLALPLDVRAICVSRIIITGGASDMPGLKSRILHEMENLIETKGWDPVMNYGSVSEKRKQVHQTQTSLPDRSVPTNGNSETTQLQTSPTSDQQPKPVRDALPERDDITDKLDREALKRGTTVQGVVRGIETLGAWAGASLAASLKVDAAFEIKREDFLRHGLSTLGNGI